MKPKDLVLMWLVLVLGSSAFGQFQLNLGGSAYGIALKKEAIGYNDLGESGTSYKNTKYLTLGVGYLFKDHLYVGFETGFNQSKFGGYQFNPFPSADADGWIYMGTSYTAHLNVWRAGLRFDYYILKDKRVSPFIGVSSHFTKEIDWTEEGEEKYRNWDGQYNRYEPFKRIVDKDISYVYWDYRLGANFKVTDYLTIALAVELSRTRISVYKNDFGNKKFPYKHEFAFPITIRYQFNKNK